MLVNNVVETLDPFEELPALTKLRTAMGVYRNKRPIIIGRDLNPRRKYRIELKAAEIMETMAVGGMEVM